MSGIFFGHIGNRKSRADSSKNLTGLKKIEPDIVLFPPPDGWGDFKPWPPENPLPPVDTPEWDKLQEELEKLARQSEEEKRRAEEESTTNLFDYMFGQATAQNGRNPKTQQAVEDLKRLGRAMTEPTDSPQTNSNMPVVYTYWGQFIDHDITANTDRDSDFNDITRAKLEPHDPADVTDTLRNLRVPALDLDSVYIDGPSFPGSEDTKGKLHFIDEKFLLGMTSPAIRREAERIEPTDDRERDLPRIFQLLREIPEISDLLPQLHPDFGDAYKKIRKDMGEEEASHRFRSFALIGDARNDENLNVAQFHLAVMRFHNATVEWVKDRDNLSGKELYERAHQLTQWHYQWLTVNDYLKTICQAGTVDKILARGPIHYDLDRPVFMPLEFSVAAFRFGHTAIRGGYDYNRNFGEMGTDRPIQSLKDMLKFTGGGATGVLPFDNKTASLPFDRVIDWTRFVDHNSPKENRFTRKIDPFLADGLSQIPDKTDDVRIHMILRHLAIRNLLRGYHLSIPSGQSVAKKMALKDSDIEVLTPEEILSDNTPELKDALENGDFHTLTPLWFYVLKEAQVKSNGNSLGPVGSNIVAETIIAMLYKDESSYFYDGNSNLDTPWSPQNGVSKNGSPITTIRDFIRFGGVPA